MSSKIEELINGFENYSNGELICYDISLDININVILSLFICDEKNSLAAAVACAASLNPIEALEKSLEELLLTYKFVCDLCAKESCDFNDFGEIIKLDDHVKFYSQHENRHVFDYMLQSEEIVKFDTLVDYSTDTKENNIAFICKELEKYDYTFLYKDITKTEINKIGLKVVKVIIPELENINVSYRCRTLGGERLKKYYKADNYYNIPHPFP